MDRLHSYWRMEYIESPTEGKEGHENPFAELPNKSDREALIVWRGKHVYLVLNKYPYNGGHLLAAPYREEPTLEGLSLEERAELMEAIVVGKELLSKAFKPDGFNVGFNLGSASGAGIPKHLHCHIVPRWEGDSNFMPVIGNTRVLPLSLEAAWERIVAHA